MVVSDKFVITLCMSSFDRLSFGSVRILRLLAAADPVIDPTVSTVTMSTNKRRMAPALYQPAADRNHGSPGG